MNLVSLHQAAVERVLDVLRELALLDRVVEGVVVGGQLVLVLQDLLGTARSGKL